MGKCSPLFYRDCSVRVCLHNNKIQTIAYAMASIISNPISTAHLAWSARGSGNPDTQ